MVLSIVPKVVETLVNIPVSVDLTVTVDTDYPEDVVYDTVENHENVECSSDGLLEVLPTEPGEMQIEVEVHNPVTDEVVTEIITVVAIRREVNYTMTSMGKVRTYGYSAEERARRNIDDLENKRFKTTSVGRVREYGRN